MNEIDILINCPVCGKKYKNQNSQVVNSNEVAFLVHTRCSGCKSTSLSVVSKTNRPERIVSMGILTDLDYQEACKFLKDKPVSCDEVLDLYQQKKH